LSRAVTILQAGLVVNAFGNGAALRLEPRLPAQHRRTPGRRGPVFGRGLAVRYSRAGVLDECWVGLDGARLFVRGWGESSGSPLLCWHGVGLTSRASLALNEAGPLLASGHGLRVLALDAPGFGKSPPSVRDGYHPHALVDLVPRLLDALGLARVAFMGFSWGGDLGCHLAARHPDRLAALVVLDAGYRDPPLDPSLDYEARVVRHEQAWQEKCAASWDAVLAAPRRRSRRWTPAIEEAARAGWKEEGGRLVPVVPAWIVAAVEHGMAQAPPSTTRPRLARSGLPVLLVASGEAAGDDLRRFGTDVPQAEVHQAEGTGHDVLADGGPDVVCIVGEWLDRVL
jgi:pimeloyl-ACP methyl ester carboxylesterase